MTREQFIRKWLGVQYQYTEQFRDEMRDDLDKVIEKYNNREKDKRTNTIRSTTSSKE